MLATGIEYTTFFLQNGRANPSRKHAYIILTSLNPLIYIVKLGFTGIYIIFLISAQKHRGGSNVYPQSMF